MNNLAIGGKITKLRTKRDLTTTELAKMVGISQAQISRLENGKQGFRSATLTKIAQALEVHPVWFFLEDKKGDDSTGKLSESAATYATVAHPRLADAMKSPQFLAAAEKLAVAFLDKPDKFRQLSQSITSALPSTS